MDDATVVCTACYETYNQITAREGNVCAHPFLDVLICKTCYQRIKTASSSCHKLCFWCANGGKHTTCLKCFKRFCVKCLRNNFSYNTFTDITKKTNWICFICKPSLLAEHKSVCEKVLAGMQTSQSTTRTPTKRRKSYSESSSSQSKRCKRSRSCDSSITDVDLNLKSPSLNDRTNTKDFLINKANEISELCFELNNKATTFKRKFQDKNPTTKILQNAFKFNADLLQSAADNLLLWKNELDNFNDKWKKEYDIALYSTGAEKTKEFLSTITEEHENKREKKKFNLSIVKRDSEVTDDETNILESSMVPQITSANGDVINNPPEEPIQNESVVEVNRQVTDDETQILESSLIPQITSANDDVTNNRPEEPIQNKNTIEINSQVTDDETPILENSPVPQITSTNDDVINNPPEEPIQNESIIEVNSQVTDDETQILESSPVPQITSTNDDVINPAEKPIQNETIIEINSQVTEDETPILENPLVPQITSANDDVINNPPEEPIQNETIIEVNILSQPREDDDDIFSQETASLKDVIVKNELNDTDCDDALDNHSGTDDQSEHSFIFNLNKGTATPIPNNGIEDIEVEPINNDQTKTCSEDALIRCLKDEKQEISTSSTDESMFENDTQKIEFMGNLNLVKSEFPDFEGKMESDAIDAIPLQQNKEERIEEALKMLCNDDDSDLFDSDLDGSVSSTSFDEDDVEWRKSILSKNANSEVNGHIIYNNNYLEEIRTSILETAKLDSLDSSELKDLPEKTHATKPCSVVLSPLKINAEESKTKTNKSSKTSEEQEIERLLNLDNLDTVKRNTGSTSTKRKLKKHKTKPQSGSPDESGSSDSDCSTASSIFSDLVNSSRISDISRDGMLDALINYTDSSSDFNMGSVSDLSSDSETEETKNIKQKNSNTDKNSQSGNPESGNKPKELTAEELAKRKWRNDPLLRNPLPTSSSSDSEEDITGNNIISQKTKKKLEELEEKQKNRESTTTNETKPLNVENKMENGIDNLDSDLDNQDGIKPSIYLESESDSDIEFVSEVNRKARFNPIKSSPTKSSIPISSDDEDSEGTAKQKGRKNIRAILSEETLAESTKQANLLEKQRKDRLTQKHRNMDSILSQSQALSQEEGLILDVDEKTEAPIIVVHPKLTRRLKNHQQQGVKFMWESCYEGVEELKKSAGSGCILAHCMGLGKTFQVVTLIHTLVTHPITNTKYILVVCPLSLVENWENEFKTGLADLNDNVVKVLPIKATSKKHRLFKVQKWRESGGVLVMGYEAYQSITNFKGEEMTRAKLNIKKALVDPGPDLVILDEGHLLKNGKNLRTRSLMKVKTLRRIILTGTPLQNNLKEYYHMVQFVKPNLLGNFKEYSNRFVNPITNGQFHDSTEADIRYMKKRSHVLHKLLGATIQRYEVTELKMYLPERYDYALFIPPHPLQIKLYTKYIEVLKPEGEIIKGSLFANYHRLHSLWTHPRLLPLSQEQRKLQKRTREVDIVNLDPDINDNDDLPESWWETLCPDDYKINLDYGPKFKVMLSIIRQCEAIGDKILIFSTSLPELDSIEFFLQHNETAESKWEPKKDYYRMDGAVLPDERIKLCNAFNDENNQRTRVFLISYRVGGLGLNLVAANRVILMDVNWNPAYDSQSVFRVYRFGQKKKCYVYRLISMGTMEEVVYQRQINKLATAGRVVDEMQISRHYTSDDLHKIYRYNFKENLERPPLPVPADIVLAQVLQSQKELYKYHEHQTLLENKPEEELNEDEMNLAWDEFNKENEHRMQILIEQRQRMAAATEERQRIAAEERQRMAATSLGVNQFLTATNLNNTEMPQAGHISFSYIPTRGGNNDKSQKPLNLPQFETVFIPNNPGPSNNSEPQVKIGNLQARESVKTKELQHQFYRYIRQFSHNPDTPSNNQEAEVRNTPFKRNSDQTQPSTSKEPANNNNITQFSNNLRNVGLRLNPAFQAAVQDNSASKSAIRANNHQGKGVNERSSISKNVNSNIQSMINLNKDTLSTERSSKAKESFTVEEMLKLKPTNKRQEVIDLDTEEQKMMQELNQNMNITLSRLELTKPKAEHLAGRGVLQQTNTMKKTSDIIEID